MFLLLLAAQMLQPIQIAPTVSPGANIAFHQSVGLVEQSIAAKNFDVALKQSRLLPKKYIKIKWDDSKVPAALKDDFEDARDKAIARWHSNLSGTEFKLTSDAPDIKIDFEPVLAALPNHAAPVPSAMFFSDSPSEPRLEAVIGLKRGSPLAATTRNEVFDEVAFALGSYFGLAPSPYQGFIMGRTEQSGQPLTNLGVPEARLAKANMALVQKLLEAISLKKTLTAITPPDVFVDPLRVALPTATQGDKVPFTVQVTNRGTGPMEFEPSPDCGCISATGAQILQPGKSALVHGQIDTKDQFGDFNRHLIIVSNDPNTPFIQIPVGIHINALYRLLGPDHALSVTDANTSFDVYLALSPNAKFQPTNARMTGLQGDVIFEPWQGELADTEQNEVVPTLKSGYKFHVKMNLDGITGKNWTGLEILTDDPYFKVLRYNLTVQKGIVAEPYQLFMGDITNKPREFKLDISRPHKPFQVSRVEFDTPHLKLKSKGDVKDIHNLVFVYDGNADPGPFKGMIKVFTDDLAQPVIEVPYAASVQ